MCKCPQMRSLAWAHVHTVTICDCCCISLYESHRTLKLNGNSFTLIIHICACTHLHNPLSSIRTNGRTHKHTHTSLTHKPFLVSRLHPHTHTLSLRSILSRERERGGGSEREPERERMVVGAHPGRLLSLLPLRSALYLEFTIFGEICVYTCKSDWQSALSMASSFHQTVIKEVKQRVSKIYDQHIRSSSSPCLFLRDWFITRFSPFSV